MDKRHIPPVAIEQIVVRHVNMRLRAPFISALGVEHERHILIVEVHGGGAVGYGEVPVLSAPTYNEETVDTAWHVLNDFFIARMGTEMFSPGRGEDWNGLRLPRAVAETVAVFKGHAFAKAGLEGAVWDVVAKQAGMSLSELLHLVSPVHSSSEVGGRRSRIPAGVVVGIPVEDDVARTALLKQVENGLQEGYRRIKLKIEPGADVEPLRAVRNAFGPIDLAVDANGSYRPADVDTLQRLDEFELSYIEQPLRGGDIIDHGALQTLLQTAICLDESIDGVNSARQALNLGSCRVVNVKASRIGGLTEAVALHDLCRASGVDLLCGGLLESGIGRAHNVALASLPGFTLPGDISASARYWERDIVRPPFELDGDGYIAVPTGPGIGVEVDDAHLEHVTVRRRVHRLD